MRMTLALILSTLIYIMVYIPMYYEVIKKYGFESASSPACSLEHLSSVSNNVSILEYLIIVALIRYVGVLILIMLSALLSRRVNGVFQITTAILAIVAVPLVLSYIGIPGTEYLLLNPLFIGNVV